jgi:hypothetical protein
MYNHKEYMKKWHLDHPTWDADWRHKTGRNLPMSKNKKCASFLGDVAEKALLKFFDHIERMPYGNPGYDFKCGLGKLIDVKSACLKFQEGHSPRWTFRINRNNKCDYFVLLAFNNRIDLEPMHVWLVPGYLINYKTGLSISNISESLTKWSKYERPLDKVIACCNQLKEVI